MQTAAPSLTRTFDYVWDRLLARIDGLGDGEYFWEPVAGCWSLRQVSDGRWLLDGDGGGGPTPHPIPVTTIVWRLGHIGGTLFGFARMRFGDGQRVTLTDLHVPPHAEDVSAFLTDHYRLWMDSLLALPEAAWSQPLGASFGLYAESNTFDLALHVLDELVHHAAEIGVLRDLWAAGLR
jgi:hypothetical protein